MPETAVLTKSELVDDVAAARHLLRRDAEVAVNAVFDSIVRSLEPGGSEVEIHGFGVSGFAIEKLSSPTMAAEVAEAGDVLRRASLARARGLPVAEVAGTGVAPIDCGRPAD